MLSCSRLAPLKLRGPLLRLRPGFSRAGRRCVASEATSVYHGPFSKTFRNLKIFSLTSFGLATSITPLFFIIESSLPLSARAALALATVGTSGISTALVSWCGGPYVSTLRKVAEGGGIEMETTTLLLKSRYTTVYDSSFLRESGRPFAKWELAKVVGNAKGEGEEIVAETKNGEGKVVGSWIVLWKDGRGECRGVGKVIRYFNVHEELLDNPAVHVDLR